MKQPIYTPEHFRLHWVLLALLFIFADDLNSTAQSIRNLIEANHKVYLPQGKGPFPVIIAIPGCSGVSLNGTETDSGRPGDEGDKLFRRHYPRMAGRLQDAGYLVLLVDYLTAEKVINTCNGEIPQKRVSEYIHESISFVKRISAADSARINIIGWSYGGTGVLTWLANLENDPGGVRSVITIYPGCGTAQSWNSSLPVLMLLGEEDDIAPPELCDVLFRSLPQKTNVRILTYPNARHGFDMAEGPAVLSIGNGLTIGRNEQAGNEAWNEILSFLHED